MLGHVDFAKEILKRKPEFTKQLDSQRSSPLHLASAKGGVEVVKALLFFDPDMCLGRDKDGRNPLHIAAMKGRIEVLRELVQVRPQTVQARVDGETVLHICVNYNQLETLKLLIERIDDEQLLNAQDDYGHTILHLAVADKQFQTIKYLLSKTGVDVNAQNANGLTALDILAQSRRTLKDVDVAEVVREAGGLRARDLPTIWSEHTFERTRAMPFVARDQIPQPPTQCYALQQNKKMADWLSRKRDTLMVVASLIATMGFQLAVNFPGGFWEKSEDDHIAGYSTMADNNTFSYSLILGFNTTGFIASLSIILLLTSGLPLRCKFFMSILTVIMWIAISSMALTYSLAVLAFTSHPTTMHISLMISYAVYCWCGLMALILLGHTIRFIWKLLKNIWRLIRKLRSPSSVLRSHVEV